MIQLRGVGRVYRSGRISIEALRGVSLDVEHGEFVALVGPSGAGKSTILNVVGCIDRPTSGSYALNGIDVASLSDGQLSRLRNRTFGFIFQSFNLIPDLTVLDNVAMPLVYSDLPGRARVRAAAVLARVAPDIPAEQRAALLSGGQQQMVAIARAVVNSPAALLADEPTGSVDSESAKRIWLLLRRLTAEGSTVILVTHNHELARLADRVLELRDGRIVEHAAPVGVPA